MAQQRTIRAPSRLSGVGLHTGREIHLEMVPAEPDTGVVFVRTDLEGEPRVAARPENLVSRPRRSALADGPAEVETTEHLLAALCGAGVQNVEVRIDGPELPGLDGSALPYYEAIHEAGVEDQGPAAREIRLREPLAVTDRGASIIALERSEGLSVGYTLDYGRLRRRQISGCPTTQFLELEITEETFAREVAPARTFVLEEEIAQLKAEGLGKGASLENTLVLGEDGIVGNRLRFEDEFVRHKILDLLGDLYLLGSRLHGHVLATKSGHGLNIRLARLIQDRAFGGSHEPGAVGVCAGAAGAVLGAAGVGARAAQRGEAAHGGVRDDGPEAGGLAGGPAVGTLATMAGGPVPGVAEPRTGRADALLDIRQIQEMLPHRYPFLLVDRITEFVDGQRAVGLKNVTFNEEFFQGHFPARPVMPGVLIVEAMAQLAGSLLLGKQEHRGQLAFLLSLDHVKFRRAVEPGDQLILEANVKRLKSRTAEVKTRAVVGGSLVAEAEIRFMLIDGPRRDKAAV